MKKRILTIILILLSSLFLISCGPKEHGLFYPDYGYADDGSDSWLQKDDEEITITWYVDSSTYSINNAVRDAIKKYTGINIDFQRPITDDGSKLNTYIVGDLPDVITITDNMVRVQLEEAGRVYPIQTLAEKYAPTLLDRIDDEYYEYYKGKNNKIYCLANNFYSTSDLEQFAKQNGTVQSNGILVVRQDYLQEYLDYMHTYNAGFNDLTVSTPQGFIDMCVWVKNEHHLSNTNPTFLMDYFGVNTLSNALTFIAEYFNVRLETTDGKYNYIQGDERYEEALYFLNELYRNNIISAANFTSNKDQLGQYIQRGDPFACLVPSQEYTVRFKRFTVNTGVEYVPIVLTNSDGEAPQLRSMAGNGLRLSMITENCSRPDRVIKLFDFLQSAEGQALMYFGVEGESFEYTIQPGETVGGVTYKYGKVKWTADAWTAIQNNDYEDLGVTLLGQGFLWNPMIIRCMHPEGDLVNDYPQYINYNLKAPMNIYTYNNKNMKYPTDPNDPQYVDMVTIGNDLQKIWIEYATKIIMASSAAQAKAKYEEALNACYRAGLESYIEFNDRYFQAYKTKLGITYAYPANDPNSSYQSLVVTSIYGDTSLVITLPENLKKE